MKMPREKHGTSHRYYNFKYAVRHLRKYFDDIEISG